jgi:hypothetical protein
MSLRIHEKIKDDRKNFKMSRMMLFWTLLNQGCGSGSRSELDPDSIESMDPDPESGSRRAKMTHKSRIFF